MCGFSLIISKNKDEKIMQKIHLMNESILHRGPDGDGIYFYKNVAMGHRRLAIIDLSDGGLQPMSYGEDYVLSYNGEIYNYLELKQELIKKGYKFKSQTDSEVILASYLEWGQNCVKKFNGMWAFTLLDKKEKKIFCSRDRFGIKPFYFFNDSLSFVAGSEIKQLINLKTSNSVNEKIIEEFIFLGSNEVSEETFFKNIFRLNQSENLIYDLEKNSFKTYKYFDVERTSLKKMSNDEILKKYEENFKDSINLRLRSDVKVGTCLSGGLDSSSIAATASKLYASEDKFSAIHGIAIEKNNDESKYANQVAKHCNLDFHTISPDTNQFSDVIHDVVWTQEEPFGGTSVFMQYFVMKKAKEEGCIVMLDGQGGDETLLGYDKYIFPYLYHQFKSFGLKEFSSSLRELKANNSNLKNWNLSNYSLMKYLVGVNIPFIKALSTRLTNNYIDKQKYRFSNLSRLINSTSQDKDIFRLQRRELYETSLPKMLKWEDRNSMRFSIETRLPFLDYRNVNFSLSIDPNLKIYKGWSKYPLRKYAEKILPTNVVWRKDKFGFNAPEKTWLLSEKEMLLNQIEQSKILKEYINFNKIKNDFNHMNVRTAWSFANIAIWEKVYNLN